MYGLLSFIICDFKRFFKDWKAIVLLITIPIILIFFFGSLFASDLEKTTFLEPFKVAVVDSEKTHYSDILLAQLGQIEIFEEIVETDKKNAQQLIYDNEIAAVIIIPADFIKNMAQGVNLPIEIIGNRAMPIQSKIVKTLLESAVTSVSAGQSAINTIHHFNIQSGIKGEELTENFEKLVIDVLMKSLARLDVFDDVSSLRVYDCTPFEYYTAALIPVFMLFAGMPGVKMIITEQQEGLNARLRSTPLKFWYTIISKLILTILLNVIQFFLIYIFSKLVFKSYWNVEADSIVVLLLGLIFAVSCWSVFVASLANSYAAVDIISYLGILMMAVISGSIYPLNILPIFIRNLSKFTINRWAMDGFMAIFSGWKGVSMWMYAGPMFAIGIVLLVTSLIITWAMPKNAVGRRV